MEIRVDGVLFVPFSEPQHDNELLMALDVRFDSDAGEQITIRDFLRKLLEKLWLEKEGFNSKRPYGNGGWEFELAAALIKNSYIKGKLDEEGYVDTVDWKELDTYVTKLIRAMCHGVISE